MNVLDWRATDSAVMARLYDAEARRWRDRLSWDTARQWRIIEAARLDGRLPGRVAVSDGGRVRGWAYFIDHRGQVQVGGLVADAGEVTAALLSAIVGVDQPLMMFGFFDAPGLDAWLRGRGMRMERYRYLRRAIEPGGAPADAALRPYRYEDGTALGDLLRRAYDTPDPCRPFAPGGSPDEWIEYVAQLTMTGGCGDFEPGLSRVAARGPLDGAALVTRIAPEAVHVAQLAVAPEARGRRVGRALLDGVMAAAARDARTITLLVAEGNHAAAGLYRRMGFEEVATFVAASSRSRASAA